MNTRQRETILVVEDVPKNIDILVDILAADYRVIFAANGADALAASLEHPQPGLILLDVMMPEMDGYEVCRRLKADLRTQAIPVIFLTALAEATDEAFGLRLGAVDFVHKPCQAAVVLQRVRIHLELYRQNLALEDKILERTRALAETQIEVVRRLGRAAEYRDNETGMHVIRVGKCCHRLALAAGIPKAKAELLELAATMHDIGKIGIPDRILLKPGKLIEDEWTIMKSHAKIGAEIIGYHDAELIGLARRVALSHHERWDGQGYPQGLAGTDIPIESRITALCDAFDVLLSHRPYRSAWSLGDTADFIAGQSGKAFDPHLVTLFMSLWPELVQIRNDFSDAPGALTQLLYISTAMQRFGTRELEDFLAAANLGGENFAVGGLLAFAHGVFMHVLEGDEAAVERTMLRLSDDRRHYRILELSRQRIEAREFGDGPMALRRLEPEELIASPAGAKLFGAGFSVDTLIENPPQVLALLRELSTAVSPSANER